MMERAKEAAAMHLAKFGGASVGKMMGHYTRATDDEGNYLTYPRADGGGHIHRERTQENYTLGDVHDEEWIDERLKGVYQKPNQKNPIRLCDIIVTLPRSEDAKNAKAFFEAAYSALVRLYGGRDNVVGAWVHNDESQPHMHFAFLPISERNSRQKPEYKEKLSTRAYWPRKTSLQEMHRTVQADVDRALGHHVDVLYTDENKDRDELNKMTLSQYKAETARRRAALQELENKEVRELKNTIKHVKQGWLTAEHVEMSLNTTKRIFAIAEETEIAKKEADDAREAKKIAEERAKNAQKDADDSRRGAESAHLEIKRLKNEMRFFSAAPEYVQENVRQYVEKERQAVLLYQRDVQRDCVRACITAFRKNGRKGFTNAVKQMSPALDEIGVHGWKAQSEYMKTCLKEASSQIRKEYRLNADSIPQKRRENVPPRQDGGGGSSGGAGGGGGNWDAPHNDTDYLHNDGGIAGGGCPRLDEGHEDVGPWAILSECMKAELEFEKFLSEI